MAVVIPQVESSSFVEPIVNTDNSNLLGTGEISVDIIANDLIEDKMYILTFINDTLFTNNNAQLPIGIITSGFEIFSRENLLET